MNYAQYLHHLLWWNHNELHLVWPHILCIMAGALILLVSAVFHFYSLMKFQSYREVMKYFPGKDQHGKLIWWKVVDRRLRYCYMIKCKLHWIDLNHTAISYGIMPYHRKKCKRHFLSPNLNLFSNHPTKPKIICVLASALLPRLGFHTLPYLGHSSHHSRSCLQAA